MYTSNRHGIQKAAYSTECTNCGICCSLEVCVAGVLAFPDTSAPCPALQYKKDGTTFCALVTVEASSTLDKLLAKCLGIGCGCSMPDADTTEEEISAFNKKSKSLVQHI